METNIQTEKEGGGWGVGGVKVKSTGVAIIIFAILCSLAKTSLYIIMLLFDGKLNKTKEQWSQGFNSNTIQKQTNKQTNKKHFSTNTPDPIRIQSGSAWKRRPEAESGK